MFVKENPDRKKGKYTNRPQLIHLTNYVKNEMTLVNYSLYSHDAVSQYAERAFRSTRAIERKRFNSISTVDDNSCYTSQEKDNKVVSKVEVCPMFNENRDIENCTYYLEQKMEERNKLLLKNKLS